MGNEHTFLRRALLDDAYVIASIARQSRRHFLPYLPELHTEEEDRLFFRGVVLEEYQVWVAQDKDRPVGFCAFKEGWLDHLYLLPSHVRRGLGGELIGKAKRSYHHLQLWVFQQNIQAISFYRRHGFVKVRETDGSQCEEKLPDALFEWGGQR